MDDFTKNVTMMAIHLVVLIAVIVIGWGLLSPTLISSSNDILVIIGLATTIGTGILAFLYAMTMLIPTIAKLIKG